MALPAVVLVLACCLSAGQLSTQQLRLQDAASVGARSIARGESIAVATGRLTQLAPRASVRHSLSDGVACVTVTVPARLGNGLATLVTLSATGCALAEQR